MRKLAEHVESECLIIFGYTSPDRREFYYPDNGLYLGRDQDNFIQAGIQWTGSIQQHTAQTRMLHPFNDYFVKDILRSYDNTKTVFKYVDSLCSVNRCHVIHLQMWNTEFDKKMFDFEGERNYISWCNAKGFKQLPFLHYGHDAHKALAHLIEEKIK
jgi:hypothetical protein